MIKTNKENVVMQSVQGKIHHPLGDTYRISHEGEPMIVPATGGISYNVTIGDPAFGWAGDHIEPGVSVRNENNLENKAMMKLACTGNVAKVVSGEAKGAKGIVLGGHGGIDHTICIFEEDAMDMMAIDDKILVKGYGQGLRLLDYPEIAVMNIDPDVFENMPITEGDDGLHVPVVLEVPPYLMGSGVGAASAYTGDYDIMTQDVELMKELGIDKLKFGDLVLLRDCDNTFGRGYQRGAVSIGIVIHSDCIKMGHGPGIATILSSKETRIHPTFDKDANIKNYL